MARVLTTGVLMTEFESPLVHWKIVGVGGRRSERKKWMRFYDDAQVGTSMRRVSTSCFWRDIRQVKCGTVHVNQLERVYLSSLEYAREKAWINGHVEYIH